MGAMFAAFSRAVAQCSDPAFRSVLLRAVGISLGLFILLWIGAGFLLSWLGGLLLDWLAAAGATGFWVEVLDWAVGALGVAGVLVASFILFPACIVIVIELMLEDIARAVERKYYPALPAAREQPWREVLRASLAFAGLSIAVNLLALPFYLLLLFLPPLNLVLFYAINGLLFGREYFELVALRRFDAPRTRRLRRRYCGRLFLAGVVIAIMMTLPFVNLIAPIIATGFMLHVFETLRQRAGPSVAAA